MIVLCHRCNRRLSGKASLERGLGPVCWQKLHKTISHKKRIPAPAVVEIDPNQYLLFPEE
jgi:hypothetical protein